MAEPEPPTADGQDHPNHPNVDQSDRVLPRNLRQSGDPGIEMLVSTRVRKSPFFHKSFNEEGAWRCTVYNRIYHPRGLVEPEDGGAMAEYEALTEAVTLWDVAVERQIRVKAPTRRRSPTTSSLGTRPKSSRCTASTSSSATRTAAY